MSSEEIKSHCVGGCYPSNIFTDEAYIQNFICPICQGVSLDAVTDEDGHAFGESCIKKCANIRLQCPISKQNYSKDCKLIISYNIRSHIFQSKVKCPNNNCKWSSILQDLEKHLKECPEQVVSCPMKDCLVKMKRKHIKSHMKKECDFNLIPCSFAKKCGCQQKSADKIMLKHLMESHAEELREAADNYHNEENMYFGPGPMSARNSERGALSSFVTPSKLRKDNSMHEFKPLSEIKETVKKERGEGKNSDVKKSIYKL